MANFIDQFKNPVDHTAEYDPADIQQNKAMGIIAYLSWLVLVPILAAPNSKFARFHANNGIVLAIVEIGVAVILGILSIIPYIGLLFLVVMSLIQVCCLVLTILGIINAANGQCKDLPLISMIKILK